jgi:hypothetical protein
MATPLLPSGLSVRRVSSSAFSGGSAVGANIQGTEPSIRQQLLEQSKQFIQTQNQNQSVVNSIQQQFQALQNQINTLAQGINNIANLIQKDTTSEQELTKQEQAQEKSFSLRKIRIGRESQIERRIENALVMPVEKASNALEGIFSRVGRALQIMFFGFLGIQALNAIKAWEQGDYERLGEIKDLVAKNILYAVGAVAAIKFGLPLVGFALRKLVSKIGGFLFSGIKSIFTSVVGKVGQFLGGIGSAITRPFRGAPAASAAGASAAVARPAVPKSNPIQRAMGAAGRAARRFGGPLIQGTVGTAIDIAMGEEPGRALAGAAAGVVGAAPAAAVGSLLGPVGAFGAGAAGYSFASGFGKEMYDKVFGGPKGSEKGSMDVKSSQTPTKTPQSPSTTPESTTPPFTMMGNVESDVPSPKLPAASPEENKESITPQKSMMPSSSDLTLNMNLQTPKTVSSEDENYWKSESDYWEKVATALESGATYEDLNLNQKEIDFLEGKTDTPPFLLEEKMKEMEPSKIKMDTEMISNKPIPVPEIKPLEEPSPNVIVTSPQTQQSSPSQTPPAGTDVPLISSSNPDNFYVLYSQLNYNVVM